jgi:tol-pal system protein YbgF
LTRCRIIEYNVTIGTLIIKETGEEVPMNTKGKFKRDAPFSRLIPPALGCFILGIALSACGANTTALKKDIQTLEQELARLKTERINLKARSSALDDKVIVYKKKLNRCEQGGHKPRLEVVKINSEPIDEPSTATYEIANENAVTISKNKDRPKLMLSGFRNPSTSVARPGSYTPTSSEALKDLAADNLGVVNVGAGLPMEAFKTAYRDYSNRNYVKALKGFSDFIRDNPQHEYADNAIFWRAECHFALGKFFKAIGEFERLMARYPRSEKAPSSLYRIGFTYDKLADRQRALEHYFRVVDHYPGTDAARRASRRVSAIEGNLGHGRGTVPTAAKGY